MATSRVPVGPAVTVALKRYHPALVAQAFSHDGKFFLTKDAVLWSRPERPPPRYVSAFHEGAARVAGRYGDGMWTLGDPDSAKDLIDAYKGAADDAGSEPGEIVLQAQFSWAPDDDAALGASVMHRRLGAR